MYPIFAVIHDITDKPLLDKLSHIPTMILTMGPWIYFLFKFFAIYEGDLFKPELYSPILDQVGVLYFGIGAMFFVLSIPRIMFTIIEFPSFETIGASIIILVGLICFGMLYAGLWLSGNMGKNLFETLVWHGLLIYNGYSVFKYISKFELGD